jgi:hypothetical protein
MDRPDQVHIALDRLGSVPIQSRRADIDLDGMPPCLMPFPGDEPSPTFDVLQPLGRHRPTVYFVEEHPEADLVAKPQHPVVLLELPVGDMHLQDHPPSLAFRLGRVVAIVAISSLVLPGPTGHIAIWAMTGRDRCPRMCWLACLGAPVTAVLASARVVAVVVRHAASESPHVAAPSQAGDGCPRVGAAWCVVNRQTTSDSRHYDGVLGQNSAEGP